MMFVRVNEHMVKCTITENEINEMGYLVEDICKNQELASEFVKCVIEKGNESGFEIPKDVHAVQATFLPNKKLVLCFMDYATEMHMEEALEHLLKTFDMIESLGKERLEEVSGEDEKLDALEDCLAELAPTGEIPQEQLELDEIKEENEVQAEKKDEKYILTFRNFDVTETFCKHSPSVVPGMLYKSNGNFFLLTDLSTLEEKERKNFLLLASEYTDGIQKDYLTSEYLEEHGDVIIANAPVQVLKYL